MDYESGQSRSKSIAILIDLSQNLILRMSGHCPNQDLNLQRDDTTYETLNGIFFILCLITFTLIYNTMHFLYK